MQQQGIRSVIPQGAQMPQGAQAPMPGQAPMQTQPMPGMMPSQSGPKPGLTAFVPSLTGLEIPQMLQLFGDPNSPIPKNRVLAAIVEKQKEMAARKSVQNQLAMQQNAGQQGTIADAVVAQAAPVQAAYGGEMHGYAGGGAVAFQSGGNPEIERILKKGPYERTPEENEKLRAAGIELTSRKFAAPSYSSGIDEVLAAEKARTPTAMTAQQMEAAMQPTPIAAPRPPSATRPGTGLPRPQNRPQAAPSPLQQLGSAVEQTGTPARDRLAEIESEGIAGIKALQDVVRQQGTVDPELMKLREAAYKSSQDIATRRESDRQAMLKAAGAPMSQNLFDNQEALFRMLGAMKGGKRIGDAFSSIGQEAGAIRGEQRKEMQRAQELGRQEQIAIDQLNQALADKRVADRSGDVNLQRQADLKVAEAQLKVTDLRSGIQKERATEEDRAKQRAIEEKRIATTVSEGALDRASRERLAKAAQTGDSRKVFDTLMDNARAEFEKWEKSPEGASSALKPGVREAKRAEFLEKQVALAKAAGVQGLDPLLTAVKTQSGAGAARGTRENPIKLD